VEQGDPFIADDPGEGCRAAGQPPERARLSAQLRERNLVHGHVPCARLACQLTWLRGELRTEAVAIQVLEQQQEGVLGPAEGGAGIDEEHAVHATP
jgi:hypothetical protein